MGRLTDGDQTERFMATLLSMGGQAGNYQLMRELQWREDEYWRIRDKILESGSVVRGRGRGGSVRIVTPEISGIAPPVPDVVPEVIERECELYERCLRVLATDWRAERGLEEAHFEITAVQGRRKTGGIWTRPDVSAISVRRFSHWPTSAFDLWTFEIKPQWQFDVMGVFEAAAHSRAATYSYVLYHAPDAIDRLDQSAVDRIAGDAERFGIGLIMFENPNEFDTWDTRVEPMRHDTDPQLLDQFVRTQLSEEARDKLLRWAR